TASTRPVSWGMGTSLGGSGAGVTGGATQRSWPQSCTVVAAGAGGSPEVHDRPCQAPQGSDQKYVILPMFRIPACRMVEESENTATNSRSKSGPDLRIASIGVGPLEPHPSG